MRQIYFTILILVCCFTGCASIETIRPIYSTSDIDKYIINTSDTLDWTYCGETEHSSLVIKRNEGEYRLQDDPLFHKFPMKWTRSYWFEVRSDKITIPKKVQPGQRMVLEKSEFLIKKELRYNIWKNEFTAPNKEMQATN